MRTLWLISAIFAMFSAAVDAGGGVRETHANGMKGGQHPGHTWQSEPGWRHPNRPKFGNAFPHSHWRGILNRFSRARFVYVVPYVAPIYVTAAYTPEPELPLQVPQVPVVAPGFVDDTQPVDAMPAAPSAVVAAPEVQSAPSHVVQFVTSGQPVDIPPGARVKKGTLYKYTHDGVSTYTNVLPPSSAGARILFSYTEVDATLSAQALFRCTGGNSQHVDYASAPVAGMDCKAVAGSAVN